MDHTVVGQASCLNGVHLAGSQIMKHLLDPYRDISDLKSSVTLETRDWQELLRGILSYIWNTLCIGQGENGRAGNDGTYRRKRGKVDAV